MNGLMYLRCADCEATADFAAEEDSRLLLDLWAFMAEHADCAYRLVVDVARAELPPQRTDDAHSSH